MADFAIQLPDVGEGIAEAELTEWNVAIGDLVQEDDILGCVMTDKAAVEVPSSVTGRVTWLCGTPGDMIAIGGIFVRIDTDETAPNDAPTTPDTPTPAPPKPTPKQTKTTQKPLKPTHSPLASPAVRQSARDAGIDLRLVSGTGPAGRITHEDLAAFTTAPTSKTTRAPALGTTDIKVIGMRRKIAEKMALAHAEIPPITIVEEIDMTALEDLRATLNTRHAATRGKLTLLPFVMRAIVTATRDNPQINATYDSAAGLIHQSAPVHIGIATQTDAGLAVPVARHCEAHSLWHSAAEITRLSQATRDGKATREDLTGSTISLTSLGPLGAIATTPIINHPEVAIVGVNKMAIRPMWDGTAFQPRKMMNISCSFDHRVVDGWDAAVFVQALKTALETPALMFIED